ncbi:hypothetical protein METBIDRAFT_10493 [Metschnikowia bicuspidata var. bicuspidata NRRL YB-4993]|uniref:Uncharacterized protein n=1 Tax=Metschnikowia bicuspidata var. bicuspidata NRRL YB-4993 TaxID=869754 RepID=A0A1A0HJK2_9ASCO|nr:hypothetical protein METBIDRAFT_10493 [Metschnikowia bicuspidata var. bicuspidata NRRL YB-4993]OBA24344.1 hypothetical protein METBIDRAFT_10493 [Metschnikowia bicuspidata var. bicuspidata NRRL YB-4993]
MSIHMSFKSLNSKASNIVLGCPPHETKLLKKVKTISSGGSLCRQENFSTKNKAHAQSKEDVKSNKDTHGFKKFRNLKKRSLFHKFTRCQSGTSPKGLPPLLQENVAQNLVTDLVTPKDQTDEEPCEYSGTPVDTHSVRLSISSAMRNRSQDRSPSIFQMPLQVRDVYLPRSILRYLIWTFKDKDTKKPKTRKCCFFERSAKELERNSPEISRRLYDSRKYALLEFIKHHARTLARMFSKLCHFTKMSCLRFRMKSRNLSRSDPYSSETNANENSDELSAGSGLENHSESPLRQKIIILPAFVTTSKDHDLLSESFNSSSTISRSARRKSVTISYEAYGSTGRAVNEISEDIKTEFSNLHPRQKSSIPTSQV